MMKSIFVTLSFCLLFFQAQAIRLGYKFSHLKPQTRVSDFWNPSNGLGVRCQLNKDDHSVAVGFEVDYYIMKSTGQTNIVEDNYVVDDFYGNNWNYYGVLFKNTCDWYNSIYVDFKILKKNFSPYILQKAFILFSTQEYYGVYDNNAYYTSSNPLPNYIDEQSGSLGVGVTTEMGVSYDFKRINLAAGIAKTYGYHMRYAGFSQLQYNFIFSFILGD